MLREPGGALGLVTIEGYQRGMCQVEGASTLCPERLKALCPNVPVAFDEETEKMGMLYKRGNTWWIKYYRNGKYYRESSGSEKKMVAKNLLDQREGEIAQGKIPGIHFDRVTFDELADYRINRKKSLLRAANSVNHLKGCFAG